MKPDKLDAQNFDDERQHWLDVRVYYEDTDFTGMVYHANYLKFFERGRSDHLRDAGVSHRMLLARPDPAAFTIINVNVTYKIAAQVDDLLHLRTRYMGVRGAKIIFSQTCFRGNTEIASAEIVAVQIHTDGRPRRPIPEIVEHLKNYTYSNAKV